MGVTLPLVPRSFLNSFGRASTARHETDSEPAGGSSVLMWKLVVGLMEGRWSFRRWMNDDDDE